MKSKKFDTSFLALFFLVAFFLVFFSLFVFNQPVPQLVEQPEVIEPVIPEENFTEEPEEKSTDFDLTGDITELVRERIHQSYDYEGTLGLKKATMKLVESQSSCFKISSLVGTNWDFVEVRVPGRPPGILFVVTKPDGTVYQIAEGDFNSFLAGEDVTIETEDEALEIAELLAIMRGSSVFPDMIILCDKSDIPAGAGKETPDFIEPPTVRKEDDTFIVTFYSWTWCGDIAKWEIPVVSKGIARYPDFPGFRVIETNVGDYKHDYDQCAGYKGLSLKFYAGDIAKEEPELFNCGEKNCTPEEACFRNTCYLRSRLLYSPLCEATGGEVEEGLECGGLIRSCSPYEKCICPDGTTWQDGEGCISKYLANPLYCEKDEDCTYSTTGCCGIAPAVINIYNFKEEDFEFLNCPAVICDDDARPRFTAAKCVNNTCMVLRL